METVCQPFWVEGDCFLLEFGRSPFLVLSAAGRSPETNLRLSRNSQHLAARKPDQCTSTAVSRVESYVIGPVRLRIQADPIAFVPREVQTAPVYVHIELRCGGAAYVQESLFCLVSSVDPACSMAKFHTRLLIF